MSLAQLKAKHAEPVPSATQLIALPFVAAVEGLVRERAEGLPGAKAENKLRVVLHRTMSRQGYGYLQQVCSYAGEGQFDPSKAGRVNAVTEGAMGHAYELGKVIRTRGFPVEEALLADMRVDLAKQSNEGLLDITPRSYLAVPMLPDHGPAVTILYADTFQFGLFANDDLVAAIIAMCNGFCRMMDNLAQSPLPGIRNYPLTRGTPVEERRTVFGSIQEGLDIPPPRYHRLQSLNFEASA